MRAYDEIGDAGWQCVGLAEDPTAQLYRTMEILGCPFHLNAIRILEDEGSADGLQTPDPCSGWSLDQSRDRERGAPPPLSRGPICGDSVGV